MVKNIPAIERSTEIRFGKHVPDSTDQADNTIVFNASNVLVPTPYSNAVYLSPIRNRPDYTPPEVVLLMYDRNTKEITESGESANTLVGGVTFGLAVNRSNVTSNTVVFTGGGHDFNNVGFVTDSNVGLSNLLPQHTVSIGSNLYVDDTGSNVLVISGNVAVLRDMVIDGNLRVNGDTTVIYTENTSIKDAFIELGQNNTSGDTTLDLGVLMHRPDALSNVVIGYREETDEFAISYTDAQPTDKTFTPKTDEDINVHVYGLTHVDANIYAHEDVLVDGNVNIAQELTVTGNVYADKDLEVVGNVYVDGNVVAYKDLLVSGNVYVDTNVNIAQELTVTGNVYADKDLEVVGNVYVDGNVVAYKDLLVSGNVYADTNVNIAQELTVTGNVYADTNVNIAQELTVTGNVYVDGDIVTHKDLLVTGNVHVDKDVNISRELTAYGNVYADKDLEVVGNVYVDGNVVAYKDLLVSGNVYADTNVNIAQELTVTGNVYADTNVNIAQELTVTGNVYVDGDIVTHKDLLVTGNVHVDKDVNISRELTAYGNVYAEKDLEVAGNVYMDGNVVAYKDLLVSGNVYVTGNVNITNQLNALDNVYVSGNVEVTKAIIISGNTHLEGDNVFVTQTMDFLDPTTAIVTDQVSNVQVRLGQLETVSNTALNPLINQVLTYDQDNSEWSNAYPDQTIVLVKNTSGVPMTRGQAVHVTGSNGNNMFRVELADASNASKMPAIGIVYEDLPINGEGAAVTFGRANGISGISEFTNGDTLYVSNTVPGGLTNVKPYGVDLDLIQNIGVVVNHSSGVVFVTGIGRANDIPNARIITDYNDMQYVYVNSENNDLKKITSENLNIPLTTAVSSSSNSTANAVTLRGVSITSGDGFHGDLVVAGNVTVDTNTLKVDAEANRVGILTASPGQTLDVRGAANVGTFTTTTGTVTDGTHSTSKDTGVLVLTQGGLGVEANIHSTNVFAASHIAVGTSATSNTFDVRGTANVGALVATSTHISDATESTSTTSGALQVRGGVSTQENLNVGGVTKVWDSTNAGNKTSGALQVTGGVGVQGGLYATDGRFSTDVSVGSLTNKKIPYANASKILTDSQISQEADGTVVISNDVEITGTLLVSGDSFEVSAGQLIVQDRIIDIANNNPDHA